MIPRAFTTSFLSIFTICAILILGGGFHSRKLFDTSCSHLSLWREEEEAAGAFLPVMHLVFRLFVSLFLLSCQELLSWGAAMGFQGSRNPEELHISLYVCMSPYSACVFEKRVWGFNQIFKAVSYPTIKLGCPEFLLGEQRVSGMLWVFSFPNILSLCYISYYIWFVGL